MTTKRRLTHQTVVEAAVALVDTDGAAALTTAALAADLGIKPPSLYNHVQGLDQLRRDVAIQATLDLGDELREAVLGLSGRDALLVASEALRAYALSHPDLYLMLGVARPDDDEYAAASLRAIKPITSVLHAFGLDEDQSIHAARTLRSALHGFVSLEASGGFGLDVDVEESFDWMVEALVQTLERT